MAKVLDKQKDLVSKESNEFLKEISDLKNELVKYKTKWKEAQFELAELNIAFKVVVKNEKKITLRNNHRYRKKLSSEVLPLLDEIKGEKNLRKIRATVEMIKEKISMIIGAQADPHGLLAMLTPMEMRIASMIKNGYKSKDIAQLQHISLDTVKTHRRNIRKKIGLKNRGVDLASFFIEHPRD